MPIGLIRTRLPNVYTMAYNIGSVHVTGLDYQVYTMAYNIGSVPVTRLDYQVYIVWLTILVVYLSQD